MAALPALFRVKSEVGGDYLKHPEFCGFIWGHLLAMIHLKDLGRTVHCHSERGTRQIYVDLREVEKVLVLGGFSLNPLRSQ